MLYNQFMIRTSLSRYLEQQGFIPLISNIEEITALVKVENNFINIIQIIDYTKELYLDFEQYNEIKQSLTKTFQERGVSYVHILSLFLKKDMELGQDVIKKDPFCWEFDQEKMELNIGEGKQADFYGMKGLIQDFINHYNPEEEKDFIDSASDLDNSGIRKRGHSFVKTSNETERNFVKSWNELPIISIVLVLINVLIFLGTVKYPDYFYKGGSLVFFEIFQGQWYRLVTSMFLHGGIDHLFNNMLLLYFLGEVLERKLGKLKYLGLYFSTGIIANLVSCFVEFITQDYHVSYGASGAVYGLIGMLLYLVIRRAADIKISLTSMLFMVVFCIYSSFTEKNINVAAHIGGLISGFLLMFIFYPISKRKNRKEG